AANAAMDHDFELLWRPVSDARPRAMLFEETVSGEPHLLVMLVPPDDRAVFVEARPRELVFVVDTSGSMHGVSIDQAKKALLHALDGLRPNDRFNVIQFNSFTSRLFPASVPATPALVGTARDHVRALTANGGTEMRPALLAALGDDSAGEYLKQIIFVTDGSVGNEEELFSLIEARLGAARLFTVGIGSAPNGWFMRKAAEAGRGSFETISALHEVQEKMARLFRKLERPMVTDIEVTWPDGLRPAVYPLTVPDLYAGEPIVLRARLARPPGRDETLIVRGRTAAGDWSAELAIAEADTGPGTAAVWARAHVAELLDRERRGEDKALIRDAVIDTALKHRIVSKYTSFVAVDKTPSRPADTHLAREQVPNLVPHGQSMQAIFGFPATATAAPVHRRNGALLIALGTLALFFNVWTLRGRPRGGDGKPDAD
ncbi:MAG: VWA domain-containing protein, partial [Woeseiaceae bacterium]|nr:VWA domain-containing protein [Woeseiaceae bacterium]